MLLAGRELAPTQPLHLKYVEVKILHLRDESNVNEDKLTVGSLLPVLFRGSSC